MNVMMKPELFNECLDVANECSKIDNITLSMQALYHNMDGKRFSYTTEQLKYLEKQREVLSSVKSTEDEKRTFEKKVYRGEMNFIKKDGTKEALSPPEILAKQLNNWKGWKCYAGLENLVIDFYGNLKRSWCGAPKTKLGNIRGFYVFPRKPVLCQAENCFCSFDMMCSKKQQ